MIVAAYVMSFLSLLLNASLLVHLKPPYKFFFWVFQIAAAVLSPILVLLGLLGRIRLAVRCPRRTCSRCAGCGVSALYISLVTVPQSGFDLLLEKIGRPESPPSRNHICSSGVGASVASHKRAALGAEHSFLDDSPHRPKVIVRRLAPPEGVPATGLAFIYLHASAWWILDKDSGTRPLFRHLVAQGHVVMDVAYRLCPEVDIYEMVGTSSAPWPG